MKKRVTAILAALALVVTQSVIFPLAASADTWVDDSSVSGGGYWIDDYGYRIDSGNQAAPNVTMPLVTGDDEPTYDDTTPITNYSLGAAPAATSNTNLSPATIGTLTKIVSDDPTALQLQFTTNGDYKFVFRVRGSVVSPVYSVDATESNGTISGTLSIMDPNTIYRVSLVSADAAETLLAAESPLNEHNYTVYYDYEGTLVEVDNGTVALGGSTSEYTAPTLVEYGGIEYRLVDETYNTMAIAYGTSNYTFLYQVFNPQDLTATIDCVDERDNVLSHYEAVLTYRGTTIYYDLPATMEVNGRSYARVGNVRRITLNYFSQILDYTVRYREVEPQNTQPYAVRVNYVDADTGTAIGGNYYTITAQNIADGANVTLQLPQEIAFYTGDSTIYYAPQAGQTVTHLATDDSVRTYTVNYERMAEDAPYTWSVRLIDLATGSTLATQNYQVTVSSSATHESQPQITVNGTLYLLDSSMQSTYTHNYNDSSRIQNVYYNAENAAAVASYDVRLRYVEITNGTEIGNETVTATAEAGSLAIPTDENITVGDETYVRLMGQSDVVNHDFYSPQRSYTIYYRDVNDEQNADTVVYREEIITTEVLETIETEPIETGETEETGEPTAPVEAPVEEGEEVEDQDAPLAEPEQGTGTTVIEGGTEGGTVIPGEEFPDEDAPLAGGDELGGGDTGTEAEASPNFTWVWVIIGGVVVAAIIVGGVILFRKKKENNA